MNNEPQKTLFSELIWCCLFFYSNYLYKCKKKIILDKNWLTSLKTSHVAPIPSSLTSINGHSSSHAMAPLTSASDNDISASLLKRVHRYVLSHHHDYHHKFLVIIWSLELIMTSSNLRNFLLPSLILFETPTIHTQAQRFSH